MDGCFTKVLGTKARLFTLYKGKFTSGERAHWALDKPGGKIINEAKMCNTSHNPCLGSAHCGDAFHRLQIFKILTAILYGKLTRSRISRNDNCEKKNYYSPLLVVIYFVKFQLCGLITSKPFGGKIQKFH
jgi:hypothetical protein